MHHHAKFRQNWPIRCKIQQFFVFQDASRLLSWIHLQRVVGGLYHCAKFGCDRCSSFNNMKVLICGAFGLKIPIHTPKAGFWRV